MDSWVSRDRSSILLERLISGQGRGLCVSPPHHWAIEPHMLTMIIGLGCIVLALMLSLLMALSKFFCDGLNANGACAGIAFMFLYSGLYAVFFNSTLYTIAATAPRSQHSVKVSLPFDSDRLHLTRSQRYIGSIMQSLSVL
jgi:ABC-type uncharacterized transport system permease subunit